MAGEKDLLLRIARENVRARKQLGWIIGLSAAAGAVATLGLLFLASELAHTEFFMFLRLALSDPKMLLNADAVYALIERIPALPLGAALACLVGIFAALRYFFRYRHTFRKIKTNSF